MSRCTFQWREDLLENTLNLNIHQYCSISAALSKTRTVSKREKRNSVEFEWILSLTLMSSHSNIVKHALAMLVAG